MTKMKTEILLLIAYMRGVWAKVTSILFLAMICLTDVGLAISDLSKKPNLVRTDYLCTKHHKILREIPVYEYV